MPFILDPAKKIPKEIVKKLKKFKNHFPTLFLAKTRWDRRRKRKKKNLLLNSVQTRLGQENSEKNSKKIEKIKKTSFRHYFFPKRDEVGREREKKKFTSEFRSYSTRARKFRKKWQKNFTPECRSYSTRPRKFRKK